MKLSYCSSLHFCKILGLTPFLTAFTYSHVNEQYGNFLIVGGTGWHEVPSAFLLRASYSAVFHSYLKAASRLTYFSLAVDTVSFTLSQVEDLSPHGSCIRSSMARLKKTGWMLTTETKSKILWERLQRTCFVRKEDKHVIVTVHGVSVSCTWGACAGLSHLLWVPPRVRTCL